MPALENGELAKNALALDGGAICGLRLELLDGGAVVPESQPEVRIGELSLSEVAFQALNTLSATSSSST
jgi:hypothetical protein